VPAPLLHAKHPLPAAILFLVTACGSAASRQAPPASHAPVVSSNLLREDYAGSAACARCHPSVHAAWQRSPMHEMTRLPAAAAIRAPWAGASFTFKDDRAHLEQHGSERLMRVQSRQFGDHVYRVTRVIGGRYREDYAGVEVAGGDPGGAALDPSGNELVLPVSYVYATGSFRLKGYSVMVGERPGLRAGGVWNQTCVLCHNTYPAFATLWGALHGPGAPSYQAVVVDRLLPTDRRLGWRVTDEAALAGALNAELQALGEAPRAGDEPRPLLAAAARTLRDRLRPQALVELGVGCEACHGGSAEHVRRTSALPSFAPQSPFLAAVPAGGRPLARAEWVNRACARCHQVLFSRYPYTWEGGRRQGNPGGSHINSGEARDFLLGGCARQMACTTCHDPHGADPPGRLAALATPAGNGTCTSCHPRYAQPQALRAHARHDPAGAGGACVACHRPRKNMGLGYQLTRYHRIGAPSDRARVEHDRPLECALCHPRARVDELVAFMERSWGKRYDRAALLRLYGSLEAEVLPATVTRGLPHEQVVAAAALAEAGARDHVPLLAGLLLHEYPLARHWAQRSLERLLGRPVPVDVERPLEEIRAALARWQPGLRLPPPPARVTADPGAGPPED
jgi:predicted CXXCH cytochrome family protein